MRTALILWCLILVGCGGAAMESGSDEQSLPASPRSPFKPKDAEATFAWLCRRAEKLYDTPRRDLAWTKDEERETIEKEALRRDIHWIWEVQHSYPERRAGEKQTAVHLAERTKTWEKYRHIHVWIERDAGGRNEMPLLLPFEEWHRQGLKPGAKVSLQGRITAIRFAGNHDVGWSYFFQLSNARLARRLDQADSGGGTGR